MVSDALKPRHAPWRKPLAFLIAAGIVAGLCALIISVQFFGPSFITVDRIDVTVPEGGGEPIVSSFRTIHRDADGGFNVRVYERLPDGRTSGRCIFPEPPDGEYYPVPYRVDPTASQYAGRSPMPTSQPDQSNTARNYWRAYLGDVDGNCWESLGPGQYFLRVEWAERGLFGMWWRPVQVRVSESFTIPGAP